MTYFYLLIYKNNKIVKPIIYNLLLFYISLNVLENNGTIIMNLESYNEKYSKNLLCILNSCFDIKYPNIISTYRKFIILKNYDKKKFINNYKDKFFNILNIEYEEENICDVFEIKDNIDYTFYDKIYYKFMNKNKIDKIDKLKKAEKYKSNYDFEDFLNLIKLQSEKYIVTTINICNNIKLQVNNIFLKKHNEIVKKLNKYNKNLCFDDNFKISKKDIFDAKYEIINLYKKKYNFYNDKYINLLKMTKFYIDAKNKKKWFEVTNIINIRKSIVYYIKNNYKIVSTRSFLKMYDILNNFNLVDLNKKNINSFSICEAPGNFVNSINYYIKSNNKNINLNWIANSLNPNNEINKKNFNNIIGDQYNYIKNYKNKWDFLDDDTGNINNINNINYIKNKYNNIELFTSDCGLELESVYDMLNQENKMLETNISQILISIISTKIGGNIILKIFIPISLNMSYSLLYLLLKYFKSINFYKQSSGSLGSSEIYLRL